MCRSRFDFPVVFPLFVFVDAKEGNLDDESSRWSIVSKASHESLSRNLICIAGLPCSDASTDTKREVVNFCIYAKIDYVRLQHLDRTYNK